MTPERLDAPSPGSERVVGLRLRTSPDIGLPASLRHPVLAAQSGTGVIHQSSKVAPMRAWPTTVEVAPSILSADFGGMREQVTEVLDAGARVIHIDVMDGHFVPVITFGPKMLADIAEAIHDRDGFADVHLMIEQPERHIAQFAAAGADSITVHVETCPHLHYTLHEINDLGCRAGVTLNPATPVEAISEAARYADVLLCMSVNPGWGGQSFIPATLERLPRMRELAGPGVAVEVDGGVAPDTAPDVYRAGANILVAGSAVFGAPSPGEAYAELVDAVAGAGAVAWR
ncbi:MAG TPA: ribulose-phosphate 3-epimerase [Gaiellales bacterium]|jgi:ribulose-phosphate 3-epimerase